MPAQHSRWGASKFERIMLCPGSVVGESDAPRSTSIYAAEGTAAHQVLTLALQKGHPASAFVGLMLEADGFTFEVDDEMAGYVQACVDYVHAARGEDGQVFADVKVDYSAPLGLESGTAWGTADVIIIKAGELVVLDFKYGRGVDVQPAWNPQLLLYALGAFEDFAFLLDGVTRVRTVISQPRLVKAPLEWTYHVDEMTAWAVNEGRRAVRAAQAALDAGSADELHNYLNPGEKQCRFCNVKATCAALRQAVIEEPFGDAIDVTTCTPEEFAALDSIEVQPKDQTAQWLSVLLSKVDMIEDWCKAIRAETERRLLAGEAVPGFKVVQGKRGARNWADDDAVEKYLRQKVRLPIEKIYDIKLKSPASIEKLVKAGDLGPRQWGALQDHITYCEGKLHVAPVSDPRPAIDIRPVAEDFTETAEDVT